MVTAIVDHSQGQIVISAIGFGTLELQIAVFGEQLLVCVIATVVVAIARGTSGSTSDFFASDIAGIANSVIVVESIFDGLTRYFDTVVMMIEVEISFPDGQKTERPILVPASL